jgi:hypothetical protein
VSQVGGLQALGWPENELEAALTEGGYVGLIEFMKVL